MKAPTKIQDFCIIFYFRFDRFSKMDHFDISFACSFFSISWEVTNYGFMSVAHLPISLLEVLFLLGDVWGLVFVESFGLVVTG